MKLNSYLMVAVMIFAVSSATLVRADDLQKRLSITPFVGESGEEGHPTPYDSCHGFDNDLTCEENMITKCSARHSDGTVISGHCTWQKVGCICAVVDAGDSTTSPKGVTSIKK